MEREIKLEYMTSLEKAVQILEAERDKGNHVLGKNINKQEKKVEELLMK